MKSAQKTRAISTRLTNDMNSRDRDGELVNKRKGKPLVEVLKRLVRVTAFQPVTFFDPAQQRQVIILYSLGEDGVIREYVNQKWQPYPVEE